MTLALLPAPMLRMLQGDGPVDNLEMIRLHLISEDGAVELTDTQRTQKDRYEFADNIMRSGLYKSYHEIETAICTKFGIGVAQARKDISNAQYLFGSVNSRNKNYVLTQHFDTLQTIFAKLVDKNDYKNAGVFAKLINDAIKMMPEDHRENNKAAAIIFNIAVNNYADLTGKEPDAKSAAEVMQKYAEDIDHEMIENNG